MKQDKQEKSGSDQFSVLLKFDSRVSTHNVRHGVLTESELKGHVSSLPDSSGNIDHVQIDEPNLNGAQ